MRLGVATMTGPRRLLETQRALDASNCLAMLAVAPRVLLDDRVREHVRQRLSEFLAEVRASGHASTAREGSLLLRALALDAGLDPQRLFRKGQGAHASDRLGDIVEDCLATSFGEAEP